MIANDLIESANEYVGNWMKFDSFVWFEEPEDSENYAIVYTENRDSNCLDRANAEAIRLKLQDCEDAIPQTHNHWAVGWVSGWAIKVFDENGNPTKAFETYMELMRQLEDYPILDDELYSDYQVEEENENWDSWGEYEFKKAIEKRFSDYTFSFSGDLREWFEELREEANVYWEDGSIDVDRVAKMVTLEDNPFLVSYEVMYIDGGEVKEEFFVEQEAIDRVYELRDKGFFAQYE